MKHVLSDVSGWLEAAKNAKLPLNNTPENLHDRLTDEDKNAKEGLREIRNEVEKVRKCLTDLGPYCAYLVSFHAGTNHKSTSDMPFGFFIITFLINIYSEHHFVFFFQISSTLTWNCVHTFQLEIYIHSILSIAQFIYISFEYSIVVVVFVFFF